MTKEEVTEKVLDEFNFYKVQKCMQALDWKWYNAEDGIPSIGEMRRAARKLINDSFRLDCARLGSGGFYVENEGGILRLSFEVADWEENYGIEE